MSADPMADAKRCSRCQQEKPTGEYPLWTGARISHCFACERARSRAKAASTAVRYRKIRQRARQRSVPFGFTQLEFIEWWNRQQRVCYYCGVEEELSLAWCARRSLSIDRLRPRSGYVPGNIVLACNYCNRVKDDRLTGDQMREVAARIIRPRVEALRTKATEAA